MLWRCWLSGREGIRPVKNWVVRCWRCYQLMPLPLTVSCFSKIRIGLPSWYRLTWVVPDKGMLNGCMSYSAGLSVSVCRLFVHIVACMFIDDFLHRSQCSALVRLLRILTWLYWLRCSKVRTALNWSFKPKLNPDRKSGFKPKLRQTSVFIESVFLKQTFRPFRTEV